MTTPFIPSGIASSAAEWGMRRRQLFTVIKIELSRNFLTRRAMWIYFLAFAPAFVVFFHTLESPGGIHCNIEQDTEILAGIVQIFYLRFGVFFGSLGIFTWLLRGEVVQRSLHYYFLAPMRREIMVLGKYLAGAITTSAVFCAGVSLCFMFMYSHFGPRGQKFVFDGPGLGHLGAYLLITVLACLGFGAVFLGLSLIFRNPIIPGAILFGWETISGVLPSLLQKLSITFYLKNLAPVEIAPRGLLALFTVVADPVPSVIAVPGLLLLVALVLTIACFGVRHMEISYSKE